MSVVAVALASLLMFIVNFVWFGPKTFFPVWWRALGRTDQPGQGAPMALVFGLTIAGIVVQALGLGWLFGVAHVTGAAAGAGHGLLVGAVFAAAASLGHRMFAGQGLLVWAIEVGGDMAGLAAAGAVLGAMG